MGNRDFEITSITELENSFNELKQLSSNINEALTKLKNVYLTQQQGYASTNSEELATAMEQCTSKASKIAENVGVISEVINKYSKAIKEADEA